jgi:hypothetical protein
MKRTKTGLEKLFAVLMWLGVLGVILSVTAPVAYALPPRPNPPKKKRTKGGGIELHVNSFVPDTGVFAIVQWQDGLGGWHDVDSWRGELDGRARAIWWVSPDHFGDGPFRWLVYRGSDGEVLGTSEPFNLPGGHRHLVRVEVSLAE